MLFWVKQYINMFMISSSKILKILWFNYDSNASITSRSLNETCINVHSWSHEWNQYTCITNAILFLRVEWITRCYSNKQTVRNQIIFLNYFNVATLHRKDRTYLAWKPRLYKCIIDYISGIFPQKIHSLVHLIISQIIIKNLLYKYFV